MVFDLSYCNAAQGKTISFKYDTVADLFYDVVVGAACSTPQPAVIYSYEEGVPGFTYPAYIIPQNIYPYAKKVGVGQLPCSVVIDSIVPSNASTDESTDGQAQVNTTTYYPANTQYSIDAGVNWQSSNVFTGIPSGNYTVLVRTYTVFLFPTPSDYCYASQAFTVGFTTAACGSLSFNTVNYAGPTMGGGSNGSIAVAAINAKYQVEYRLGAGAWQDSPTFTGLAAGAYNLQARYKAYTGCVISQIVTLADGVTCAPAIDFINVTAEQTQYGNDGALQIAASSAAGGIEYSIDDGDNYQSNSLFLNLAPGLYHIRIKDSVGCEVITTATIPKFRTLYLSFPRANSLRVVVISGPSIRSTKQNFDNRLFADERYEGIEPGCYYVKAQTDDIDTQQWRSNYANNLVEVINHKTGASLGYLTAVKQTNNLNVADSRAANFCDAGANKTQIWFNNGLPSFYKVGQGITVTDQVSLNGSYNIDEIRQGTGEAENNQVLVISKVWAFAPVLAGTVNTVYDQFPYDTWEVQINWGSLGVGKYHLKFTGSDVAFAPYTAQSEPVDVQVNHYNSKRIRYRNNGNSKSVDYNTGIIHSMRVECDFINPLGGGERTVHRDSAERLIKLEENVQRNPQLLVKGVPRYIIEQLDIATSCDWFELEDVEYQREEDLKRDYIEGDSLHNCEAKLSEVDFNEDNGDDSGASEDSVFLDVNNEFLEITP